MSEIKEEIEDMEKIEAKIEEEQSMLTMPVIPLRGMTILPGAIIHFDLNREKSVQALEYAMMKGSRIFLTAQKDAGVDDPGEEDLYRMGTVSEVKQVTRLPHQIVRVLVEGICRGELKGINGENPKFLEAYVALFEGEDSETRIDQVEKEAMLRQIKEYFTIFSTYYPKLDKNALQRYAQIKNPQVLMDQI